MRIAIAGVALAAAAVVCLSAATSARELTFEDRVQAQQAIEQVYWNHRIWPEQNHRAKASLGEVLPESAIRRKVSEYLRLSDALRKERRAITQQQLLDEMDRMVRDTTAPGVLRELFSALGDDTYLITETLVRQKLVERRAAAPVVRGAAGAPTETAVGSEDPVALESGKAPVSAAISTATASKTSGPSATSDVGCGVEAWSPTSTGTGVPDGRTGHTAVWTGSEMIVWGGSSNTGGRYDPATDSWAPTSETGAPDGRGNHTAVWTGTEMIVWGGYAWSAPFNTGGRYNPVSDTWVPTSTIDAPSARSTHAAVWTGDLMVVWGLWPWGGGPGTGGRYDPATDVWTPTDTASAPEGRDSPSAVWTGTEMIVWGGRVNGPNVNTGGRYDPVADHWSPTSTLDAPQAREGHAAVWTGAEMIVWGGSVPADPIGTGGRYDPSTDRWTPTSGTSAPSARRFHTGVWSGSEMIIWGGTTASGVVDTGGRYDPLTDRWVPTTVGGAPAPRAMHTAVWSGTEMIAWGGSSNTGGRYCPGCDDGNPCTVDSYDPATGCVHTPTPGVACDDGRACTTQDTCSDTGSCVGQPLPPGGPCDDGNACTTNDSCIEGGYCAGGPPLDCADGSMCTQDTCNPSSGCQHRSISCEDSNVCTTDSCDPLTGCVHTPVPDTHCCAGGAPVNCDDNDACSTDLCDPAIGCTHPFYKTCVDGDLCNGQEWCDPAVGCVPGVPLNCDDHNVCTDDYCTNRSGCQHAIHDCNDGNACTMDFCNSAVGCFHSPMPCSDGNPCTADSCNPSTGGCVFTPTPGVACNDNSVCTTNDACDATGHCTGTPLDCDDGNPCSADSCSPATGCFSTVTDPSCKEPKSVNFYRRVCRKEHKDELMTDANVDCVNDSATFAPVDTVDAMCERLYPDPGGDKCEQAEAQFMATLLNRCKGRITDDQPLDSKCSDHTVVWESIAESDRLLSSPSRTPEECTLADCEATEINSGKAISPVLTLTMQPDGGVRLDWTAPPASESYPAPTKYVVWRGPIGGGPFVKIAEETGLSHVDPPSETGGDYAYEVTAER